MKRFLKRGCCIARQYGNLFALWEITLAKKLIYEYIRKFPFLKNEGIDDLTQECLTQWYFKKGEYDPSKKASIKTYAATIIRNKLLDLVKSYSRDKRKISRYAIDTAGQDEAMSVEQTASGVSRQPALGPDLSKALQKLTSRQRRLCRLLLDGLSVTEAAKRLGINRRTVYDDLARIKKSFISDGFRNYF